MFEPIQKGNFGLTDEAIYKSIQQGGNFIPVWGGEQKHVEKTRLVSENGKTKYGEPITIFNGEGIIISLDGSVGCMTYVRNERFGLNHHAGFFKVRNGSEYLIDPKFFSLFYEAQLREAGVSEGSKTLSLEKIYSIDFEIPDYTVQYKVMETIQKILIIKEKIEMMIKKLGLLKEKAISRDYQTFQVTNVPISDVLDCLSGNSGLTEEYLYSRIQDESEKKYRILTGSTNYELKQYTHKCRHPKNTNKTIATVDGKEVIHVVRKGKAGSVAFFGTGDYTLNDDAYLLYLRDSFPYQISLRWLMYDLKPRFLEYASSSDNGTWTKTGFFKNVKIDLPSIEEQKEVIEAYERLERLEKKLNNIKSRIDNLFRNQISVT